MLSMVSHTLKLVILGGKLTSVKKIIAGGQTTVHVSLQINNGNQLNFKSIKEVYLFLGEYLMGWKNVIS
jgi:hypothetical protein